jgi:hypothetical protein
MSKLSSFSNKIKHRVCDAYIKHMFWAEPTESLSIKGLGCFFNEIVFFDKEEKIIETANTMFIISSFKYDEQSFWNTLEEKIKQ